MWSCNICKKKRICWSSKEPNGSKIKDITKQTKVSSPQRPAVGRIEALHRRMCTSMKRVTSKRRFGTVATGQHHRLVASWKPQPLRVETNMGNHPLTSVLRSRHLGTFQASNILDLVLPRLQLTWAFFGSHELQLPSKFVRHHGLSVGLQNGDLWQGTKQAAIWTSRLLRCVPFVLDTKLSDWSCYGF